jgi:hypothetical protein
MIVQAAPYAVAREETFLESHWQSCRGVQGWLGDRNAPGSICYGALARSSASSITCKLMDYEKHPEHVALVHVETFCLDVKMISQWESQHLLMSLVRAHLCEPRNVLFIF